jgi:hypothetical protein
MRLLVLRLRRTQPVQPLLVVDGRLAIVQAGADLADMLGYTTKQLRGLTLPGRWRRGKWRGRMGQGGGEGYWSHSGCAG